MLTTEFLAGGCIVSVASAVVIFLLLRPLSHGKRTSRLTLLPEDLGGYTVRGLVLSSALGLYLELLLIRWISSKIRVFAYFKNFVAVLYLGAWMRYRSLHGREVAVHLPPVVDVPLGGGE